jgi:signal transduction histidine kinase
MRDPISTSLLEELSKPGEPTTRQLLDRLQKEFDADGCVLWEPSIQFDPKAQKGELFCVDSTLPTQLRNKNLTASVLNDTTGRLATALTEITAIDNDFARSDEKGLGELVSDLKFRRVCAAKVIRNDKLISIVSLYRKEREGNEFTKGEATELASVARVLPVLYKAITDRSILEMVDKVRNHLFKAQMGFKSVTDEAVLGALCYDLSKHFHCREVSVFLRANDRGRYVFKPLGSTWHELVKEGARLSGKDSEGLTGWVLQHKQPLRLLDLRHFEQDLPFLKSSDSHRKKDGLTWIDDAKVIDRAKALFQLNEVDQLPPIGFVAVPIEEDGEILGALRCSLGNDPFFFSQREEEALSLVASMLGTWWRRRIEGQRVQQETKVSDAILDTTGALLKWLSKGPSTLQVSANNFQRGALVEGPTGAIFTRVEYCKAVSLRWKSNEGLSLASFRHRDRATEAKVRAANLVSPFCFRGGLGMEALHQTEGKAKELRNCSVQERDTYAGCSYLVCYPIQFGGICYGVLDVAFAKKEHFDANKRQINALSAIASRSAAALRFINDKNRELQESARENQLQKKANEALRELQLRAYAGVAHQIKSPLQIASERCRLANEQLNAAFIADPNLAIQQSNLLQAVHRHVERIFGQCRKGRQVAQSMELFAKIASEKDLNVNPGTVQPGRVKKLVNESLKDHEFALGQHEGKRGHYCKPDPRRALHLPMDILDAGKWPDDLPYPLADVPFLEQVIDAVVGNAFKYANMNSDIFVRPWIDESELVLDIWEEGVILTPEFAEKCRDLFWRSPEAQERDANGSGLGLFLTSRLLGEMGGRLLALPTDANGITVMQIRLPLGKEK